MGNSKWYQLLGGPNSDVESVQSNATVQPFPAGTEKLWFHY